MKDISIGDPGLRRREEMTDQLIDANYLSSQFNMSIEKEEEKGKKNPRTLEKLQKEVVKTNKRLNDALAYFGTGLN